MSLQWNVAEFSVEDLLSMAAAMEQAGFDYYNEVIQKATEPRVKNEVRFLRDEEALHKNVFQEMLKKKGKAAVTVSGALQQILQKEVITPLEEMRASKKISSNRDALNFGAAMERASIEFYKALAAQPAAAAMAPDINAVIKEEEGHLRKIAVLLAY
jgi:rubrerythrin